MEVNEIEILEVPLRVRGGRGHQPLSDVNARAPQEHRRQRGRGTMHSRDDQHRLV
jgi:hypothetical protein